MDHGVRLVESYLRHQMAKIDDPRDQITCWIRGLLAQTSHARAARPTRAIVSELAFVLPDPDCEPLRDGQ